MVLLMCVFLSMKLILKLFRNPFSVLFGSDTNKLDNRNNIIGRIPIQHRTLKAFDNDYPFDEVDNGHIEWWHRAFTRHALIWLVNLFIISLILMRLLVYGEVIIQLCKEIV